MSKRNSKGQYAGDLSKRKLGLSWLGSLFSLGLLYVTGGAVLSTIGSFRSCNANSSGLFVRNCGKQSLNVGDFIIFAVFIASAALTVSAITAAWRITARKAL